MSDITQAQQSYEQQRAFGNELIRRQRELAHAFRTMLDAGRRDFERTRKELEDRLDACEAARQKKRQEAETEYKRAMDEVLAQVDQIYPGPEKESQEEKKKREQDIRDAKESILSQAQSGKDSLVAREMTNIASLRADIRLKPSVADRISKLSRQRKRGTLLSGLTFIVSFVFICIFTSAIFTSISFTSISSEDIVFSAFLSLFLSWILSSNVLRSQLNSQKEEILSALNDIAYRISALYAGWLKLIDQETEAQKSEIHRQYQQAVEQAKVSVANFWEQREPQATEFTAFSNQAIPPWDDPAWETWQPGMGTPGVVRLGKFIYPPKTK